MVYIHRYSPDLIARLRTGYIHPQQARYRTQIELLQEQIDMAGSTSEKVKLSKQLKKINEQLSELNKYEEIVHHWADKMEPMDLDDGVKVAQIAKVREKLSNGDHEFDNLEEAMEEVAQESVSEDEEETEENLIFPTEENEDDE